MKAVLSYCAIVAALLGAALFFRGLPHMQGILVTGVLLLTSGGIAVFLNQR